MKALLSSRWFHPLLLLLWIAIGTGLRLTQLAAKPPWTDEFCTIVFSLGNSFRTVPLDRAISLDVLLQPLQPNPDAEITDVVQRLLTESNHPPLYFMLAHWWMQLWPPNRWGLASVWAARALPALFGGLSIPAIYGLGWLAFRSRLVGQMAAAMMAVSPYGIFLAQEARHYTLAILWVIASLSCLVVTTRHIHKQTRLPTWVVVSWIGVNFLGVSTHYFFSLTLCAEVLWLIVLGWRQSRGQGKISSRILVSPWWQILIVAVGTLVGCLVWLSVFHQGSNGGELTNWIESGDRGFLAWISPVFQVLAVWISIISLLPVEAPSLTVVIASGLVMLGFFCWVMPILSRGLIIHLKHPTTGLITQLFVVVVWGAVALFFFFTYALGIDLTRGARYNFVYFPAMIVLLGAILAVVWHSPPRIQKRYSLGGKKSVALILLMGLLSGLTVVCNLGYHKYYRPELLVSLIQQVSQSPVLIATTHKTHVQTGEMMGLAREFKISGSPINPLFLLAHQAQNPNTATVDLQQTLSQLPQPQDVWLVNFHAPVNLKGCIAEPRSYVYGYDYQLYHCQ